MKIALIGAAGQLGSDIQRANTKYSYEVIPITHEDMDVTDFNKAYKVLKEIKPEVIINTSAFHKVDDCEKESDKAYAVNTIGVRNLGVISNELNSPIVQISTDYVFDGEKEDKTIGYTEFDVPNPTNIYGISKLRGEKLLSTVVNKYYIVRTAWLFGTGGSKSKGGNFVTTMLRLAKERDELKVVNDQIGTPTNTYHLACQILELIKYPYYGTYHATCEGMTSWYDYALEIFRQAGVNIRVVPVSSNEFKTLAKRPDFSVLENKMLKLQDINIMPEWQKALAEYLEEIL